MDLCFDSGVEVHFEGAFIHSMDRCRDAGRFAWSYLYAQEYSSDFLLEGFTISLSKASNDSCEFCFFPSYAFVSVVLRFIRRRISTALDYSLGSRTPSLLVVVALQ